MLKGKHLIAGKWTGGEATLQNDPVDGGADSFAVGTPADVDAVLPGISTVPMSEDPPREIDIR